MNWHRVRWWGIYIALWAVGTLLIGLHARWWEYAIVFFCAQYITTQVEGRR